jgi:hypothetical protein
MSKESQVIQSNASIHVLKNQCPTSEEMPVNPDLNETTIILMKANQYPEKPNPKHVEDQEDYLNLNENK